MVLLPSEKELSYDFIFYDNLTLKIQKFFKQIRLKKVKKVIT